MPVSPKLQLVTPSRADQFSTQDYIDNWGKIDAAPGAFICTSSTRPSWTTAQAGRKIIETDTLLEWMWDGAKFVRLSATGLLKRSDGTWAIGSRTSDFSTTSQTFVKVVSVTNIVVPGGQRPIQIQVQYNNLTGDAGFSLAILRSNTNASGPIVANWGSGATGGDSMGGGVFSTIEPNGLAPGTYDYSFQIHSNASGRTSTVMGSPPQPITISVIEL